MKFGGTAYVKDVPIIPNVRSTRRRRDVVILFAIALTLVINLTRLSLLAWPDTAAALPASVSGTTPTHPATQVKAYTASASAPGPADTQTISVQAPATCTSQGYQLPNAIDLSGEPAGLTSIVDTPTYYQVYGTSLSSLRTMITDCPYRKPIGNYQATTSYRLSWQYNTELIGEDACRLTNIQVGMHVNQFLPLFVQNSSTPTSLASHWNDFSVSLKAHEDGHVTIDERYAQKLNDALSGIGTMSCNGVKAQAGLTVNSYVTMLNAANDLYDAQTNHGATQGAAL